MNVKEKKRVRGTTVRLKESSEGRDGGGRPKKMQRQYSLFLSKYFL